MKGVAVRQKDVSWVMNLGERASSSVHLVMSVKRKGYYIRTYVEPKLRAYASWPADDPLWEEFMRRPQNRQTLSLVGNLGITTLAVAPATMAAMALLPRAAWIPLVCALLVLFGYDGSAYLAPRRIAGDPSPDPEASRVRPR